MVFSNICFISPLLGEMIQFDDNIFQMGWWKTPNQRRFHDLLHPFPGFWGFEQQYTELRLHRRSSVWRWRFVAVGFHEVIHMFFCGGEVTQKKKVDDSHFGPFSLDRNMFQVWNRALPDDCLGFVVAKDGSVVSTDQDKNGTVCQSMRMHV